LQLPVGSEKGFRGVIDLVAMKAHIYKPDGDGKPSIEEIPAALADEAKEAHEKLVEMVAEGDDELMEEFFREGTIPIEDLIPGVRKAIVAEKIFPVLMVSALRNVGTASLLTFLADAFPHPDEHAQVGYKEPNGKGDRVERKYDDGQPLSLFVFKTLADPFAGRINYFKVKSGVLKNDATLMNFNRNTPERFQHTQVVQGKQLSEIAELHAGDIGAIAKLKETTTGDTLGDKAAPIFYKPAQIPEPSITFAVEPKTRADEDKIGVSIHKIMEEDAALRFMRDPQTKEFLLAGSGQQHIEVVVAKLHKRYNVNLTLKPPKVPYRETIRGKASIRNSPAGTANSAFAGSRWNPSSAARASNSSTTFSAARFPEIGSPRSRGVFATPRRADISRGSPSLISAPCSMTVSITTSIRRTSPSKSRAR
jgi:elongation factor G